MENNEKNTNIKKQKNLQKILGYFGIFLIVISVIIGIWYVYNNRESNFTTVAEVAKKESLDAKLKEQFQPKRDYGYGVYNGKKFNMNEIFAKLDPIPEDFFKYKAMTLQSSINPSALCSLNESYYMQPEFIRNNFVDFGIDNYRNPNPTHWTPEGYGTYPHMIESKTNPGQLIEVCAFFHSAWGVETYQGFSLNAVYPKTVYFEGLQITVNDTESMKYITATISPDSVLIEPSYSPLYFERGWNKKINMSVYISPNTPKGIYAIGFDVGRAPMDKTIEWTNAYGKQYQGKSGIKVSRPQFVLVITV